MFVKLFLIFFLVTLFTAKFSDFFDLSFSQSDLIIISQCFVFVKSFFKFFQKILLSFKALIHSLYFSTQPKLFCFTFKSMGLIFPRFYLTGWHRSPASFGDLIIISQYVEKYNMEYYTNIKRFLQDFMWKSDIKNGLENNFGFKRGFRQREIQVGAVALS